jgi:hypothetical protein
MSDACRGPDDAGVVRVTLRSGSRTEAVLAPEGRNGRHPDQHTRTSRIRSPPPGAGPHPDGPGRGGAALRPGGGAAYLRSSANGASGSR